MQQFELKCFGTADGTPCADRYHSAFLYTFGEASFIVDCGEPLCHSFKAAGLDFNGFDRVLLSHLHFDHIGGFFMFVQGLWLEKRGRALRVHLPTDGLLPIQQTLEAACLCKEILPFKLVFEPILDRQVIRVKHVRVTPVLNTHFKGFQRVLQKTHALRFEAFSFLFEAGLFRVAHSADIGAVTDLEPLLERPLDLLVCEMAHVHPETLLEFLRGRAIRCIAFIHFGRKQWARLQEIREIARRLLPEVTLLYPKDGQVISLRQEPPAKSTK
jgi:ribonuclease Z